MVQVHKLNMFTRARLKLPLSPAEHAFIEFLWGALFSAIVSGMLAAVPFVETQTVNWKLVITSALVTTGVNLFNALRQYCLKLGDSPLATLAGDVGSIISHALPTADPVTPPVASPAPNLNTTATVPVTVTTAPQSNI